MNAKIIPSERYYHDQEDVVTVDQEGDKEKLKLLTQKNGQMTLTSNDTVKPHHNDWHITDVRLSGLACTNVSLEVLASCVVQPTSS
jgi:hypothetical protein